MVRKEPRAMHTHRPAVRFNRERSHEKSVDCEISRNSEMTKLYFASDDALVALTIKGGNVEYDLHLRGNKIACVTVDPLCPHLIYCGTFGSGLWSSDNAGVSWRPAGKNV